MRKALAYVAAAAALAVCGCLAAVAPAGAEGLSKQRSKIAAPQQAYQPAPVYVPPPAEPSYRAHTFYAGGVLGFNWGQREASGVGEYEKPFTFLDGTETVSGGIVAGYLFRPSQGIGMGVEADYVVRDLGDFTADDATATVRGRLGVFVGDGTFLFGTAGVGEVFGGSLPDNLSRGLVVGGGVEKDIFDNAALRLEVLHQRHADSHFEWGDEGSTTARGVLLVKF